MSSTVLVIALAVIIVLLSGCGADAESPPGDGGEGDGPRVAHARFEGDFTIAAVTIDGRPLALTTAPAIIFETVFGGLTVKPGCNTYFGSFTLAEDGSASFTVGGGSSQDCGRLDAQEEAILGALAEVSAWSTVDGGFRFDGPSGPSDTSITTVR